ncbi:MAG: alpha/beta hydrolase [Kiloniellales bacterium]|nr:alpha/beta hydrolase [Kiloniellales bacterium]
MDHRTLTDEELERHLNPRVAAPGFEAHLADYAARSAVSRAKLEAVLDLPFGKSPLERLDVFPAASAGAPVQVFVHGGYWRALDKSDHSFAAEALVAAGATVVAINYDLCPAVTLDRIVAQTRAAVAWTYRNIAAYGGDPERIFLSGHSAGAHLAVMALLEDWPGQHGLPPEPIKGVTAISGVYDLAPVLRISVNDDVRLTAEMAARNSPTLHPPRRALPLLLAVGAEEPAGWIQQTLDFRRAFEASAGPASFLEVPDRNHFSVLYDLADPETALCRAVLQQMGLA